MIAKFEFGCCVCALALLAITAGAFADGTDVWVGRKFMPAVHCRPGIGDRDVSRRLLDLPIVVQKVNGEWLWVGRAWIKKSEVVPLDRAPGYYTEFLRSCPDSSEGYLGRAVAWYLTGDLDKALHDLNEAISVDPFIGETFCTRGSVWDAKGRLDEAIRDYTEAIRLNPLHPVAYHNRGRAWMKNRELDKALADFDDAIRLDPLVSSAYYNRGRIFADKNELEKALKDYTEAIRLDPTKTNAYGDSAWILATADDATIRDGKRAVESATKACALSGWKDQDFISVLAAARAEAGDFSEAVKWETKAAEILADKHADEDDLKACKARLELYKSGKPYRESLK
jgi:predicted Zn-dependent protease